MLVNRVNPLRSSKFKHFLFCCRVFAKALDSTALASNQDTHLMMKARENNTGCPSCCSCRYGYDVVLAVQYSYILLSFIRLKSFLDFLQCPADEVHSSASISPTQTVHDILRVHHCHFNFRYCSDQDVIANHSKLPITNG